MARPRPSAEVVTPAKSRIAFRAGGDMLCLDALEIDQEVSGTWEGIVRAVTYARTRDGVILRRHVVEIMRAEVE